MHGGLAEGGGRYMNETLSSKVKYFFRRIICKIFGHKYGCCNKIFHPCKKCLLTVIGLEKKNE